MIAGLQFLGAVSMSVCAALAWPSGIGIACAAAALGYLVGAAVAWRWL